MTLVVPEPWVLTPEGVSFGVYHALDFQVGLAADGSVVVRSADLELRVAPDDSPLPDRVARALREAGASVDGQDGTLDQLLADIAAMPTLGDLLREYPDAPRRGLVDGRTFLFDLPAGTPSVWGDDPQVLWAVGEGLMITGPQSVHKTAIGGQLALGLAGVPGFEELLGYSVRPLPPGKVVLYLALDRPPQIARNHRRLVVGLPEESQALVQERVLYQLGADLPFEVLKEPAALAAWALEQRAGAVVVDSTKDLAHALSDEQVGAALNEAFQACLLDGVEVALLHHQRKANSENRKPRKLDDVHGSGNLTRGLGSVVLLWGTPGDEEVELSHLKPPAEPVGPVVVSTDRESGRSTVLVNTGMPSGQAAERRRRVRAHYLERGGVGVTFTTDELVESDLGAKRTLERALPSYVTEGWLRKDAAPGKPTSWTMVAPFEDPGAGA